MPSTFCAEVCAVLIPFVLLCSALGFALSAVAYSAFNQRAVLAARFGGHHRLHSIAFACQLVLNGLGLAGVLWVGEQGMPGAASVYLSVLIFFCFPLYAQWEAHAAQLQLDARNHWMWRSLALMVLGFGFLNGVVLAGLSLWGDSAVEAWAMLATVLLCAALPLCVLWMDYPRLERWAPALPALAGKAVDQPGLFMLGLGSVLFLVPQILHPELNGAWSAYASPEGFALNDWAWPWVGLGVVLMLRVKPVHRAIFSAGAMGGLTLLTLCLVPLAMLLVVLGSPWPETGDALAYKASYGVWALVLVILLPHVMDAPNSAGRRVVLLMAVAIALGAGLVPGNIWNLLKSGHDKAGVYAYVVNNSILSVAIYGWLNACGARSYAIAQIKQAFAYIKSLLRRTIAVAR